MAAAAIVQPTILMVKLSEIDRNEKFNCRTKIGDVADLAKSIGQIGLSEPPIVRAKKGGGYSLVAGFRRCAALESLHGNQVLIPVQVREFESEELAELFNLSENTARDDLRKVDLVKHVHKLFKVRGLQQKKIAETLKLSQSAVSKFSNLWDALSNPIKEWWGGIERPEDEPTITDLEKCAALGTPAKQKAWLDARLAGVDMPDDDSEDSEGGDGEESAKPKKRGVREIKAAIEKLSEKNDGNPDDSQKAQIKALRWVMGEIQKL